MVILRYLFIAAGIHYTMGFQEDDVFYTPLPLYHTAGGIMCIVLPCDLNKIAEATTLLHFILSEISASFKGKIKKKS